MENNKKFISLANLAKFKELLQAKVNEDLAKKVDKEGYIAFTQDEKTKLAGLENYNDTELRGRVEELEKFELPENLVQDANYKHITVTANSVSDGTTTFTKYDDTALAARVKELEDNPYELPGDVVQDSNYATRMSAVEAGVAGIDGKVAAGVAEAKGFTYSKDEIDTKVQGAKDYADGKASTAESNAKTYAAEQVSALKTELLGPGATEAMDTIAELAKALADHEDAYDALLEVVGEKATTEYVNSELAKKANASDVYTKEEADGKFLTTHQDISGKADKTYVDGELANKADKTDLEAYLPTAGGTITGDVVISDGVEFYTEMSGTQNTIFKANGNEVKIGSSNYMSELSLSGYDVNINAAYLNIDSQGFSIEHDSGNEYDPVTVSLPAATFSNSEVRISTSTGEGQGAVYISGASEAQFYAGGVGVAIDAPEGFKPSMSIGDSKKEVDLTITADTLAINSSSRPTWNTKDLVVADDIADVVRDSDITDVVREGQIADVVRTSALDSYYTKGEADGKFLTEHQDISGKADRTELEAYLPLAGGTLTGDLNVSYGSKIVVDGGSGYPDAVISTDGGVVFGCSNDQYDGEVKFQGAAKASLTVANAGDGRGVVTQWNPGREDENYTKVSGPIVEIKATGGSYYESGEERDIEPEITLDGDVYFTRVAYASNGYEFADKSDLRGLVHEDSITDVVRTADITDVVRTSDIEYAEESDIIALFN